MKKSIGWFVSTLGTFCLYQGNLNSKMRHKLKALVKEEALDAKPEQTLQQTMHSVNTRQEISSSDAGFVPGMGRGGGGEEGILLGILGGLCRPVLKILTLFQTPKMSFSPPFFRPDF